jgi:glutathione S-transferase
MTARLVTIPISHFCEKARWALDRAQVDYLEEPHLQLVHVVAAWRAGGGRTVPVFVSDTGEVLGESAEILRWADQHLPGEKRLYPDGERGAEAAVLESWLDQGLGPDGRLWLYHVTLPVIRDMEPWAVAGIPLWERRMFRAGRPAIGFALRRYLDIDARAAAVSLERVEAVFDEIARRLSDGRRFLLGDRFTAADLAFAALSAPMLLPRGYGSPLPPPEAMPSEAAQVVERLRAHPAGAFASRMYAEKRPHTPR